MLSGRILTILCLVSGVVFARGFEPDLSLIGEESTGEMATAFLTGARIAYLVPVGVGLVALFAAFRTRDPENAHETAVDP